MRACARAGPGRLRLEAWSPCRPRSRVEFMADRNRPSPSKSTPPRLILHPSRHDFTAPRERTRRRLYIFMFSALAILLAIELVAAVRWR